MLILLFDSCIEMCVSNQQTTGNRTYRWEVWRSNGKAVHKRQTKSLTGNGVYHSGERRSWHRYYLRCCTRF